MSGSIPPQNVEEDAVCRCFIPLYLNPNMEKLGLIPVGHPGGISKPCCAGEAPRAGGVVFFCFFLPVEDLRPVIHGARPCLFSFSDDVPGNMT